MGFQDIFKSGQDFVNSITNFLKNGLYPDNKSLKSNVINKIKTRNWDETLPYSFKVIDKDIGDNVNFSYINSEGNKDTTGFGEFKLQLNPQSLVQTENFSVNVTPTQNGIISEHNGIVLRDLIISGTTGLYPRKGSELRKPSKNNSNSGILTGDLMSKTGYQEFQELRNYFRAYSEYKKQVGDLNRAAIMIFINRKDNEQLIIEPLSFTMERQAPKSFLYDYKIICKVIDTYVPGKAVGFEGILEQLDSGIDKVVDTISEARSILSNGIDILTSLEREVANTILDPLREVSLFVKTVQNVGRTIADMNYRFVSNFSSDEAFQQLSRLYDDINTNTISISGWDSIIARKKLKELISDIFLAKGIFLSLTYNELSSMNLDDVPLSDAKIRDIEDEEARVIAQPRSFYENLLVEVQRVRDNAIEQFGLGDSRYNEYADRISTVADDYSKVPTSQEIQLLEGFNLAEKAILTILTNSRSLIQGNTEEKMNSPESYFNNEINIDVPSSVTEVVIPPNTTVEDLSYQYLRDYSRWIDIVQLNNLIPPYIDDISTNPRIKKPGDKLLIPGTDSPTPSSVSIVKENKYNTNLNELEKRMGIDIKLGDNFDIVMNNNNDFILSVGGDNAGQAFVIKLNIEKGDLKLHREIGIGKVIGEKITTADDVYDSVLGSILQDPRFERINNFRFSVDGSTILMQLDLTLAGSAKSVPVSIPL